MARPVGGKLGCHDANHDTQGGWRPGRSFPEQKWEWTNICVFVHLLASQEKKNTSLTKVTFICFLSSPRALHADLCQMLSKSYLYQRIPCAWKIFFPINSLLIVKAAVLSIINLSSLLPLLCVLQSIAFFDTGWTWRSRESGRYSNLSTAAVIWACSFWENFLITALNAE